MPALLRNINIAKWVRPEWSTADEDIPADALYDLRSVDNTLSVWVVASDAADLSVVLTAFASAKERLDKLDYVLIDETVPPAISIKVDKCEGLTPYSSANHMHRNLAELTVRKVSRLAEQIMPLEKKRITEKQIKAMLLEALSTGVLDRTQIKPKLLNQLAQ